MLEINEFQAFFVLGHPSILELFIMIFMLKTLNNHSAMQKLVIIDFLNQICFLRFE